jgi:hypothetical protein
MINSSTIISILVLSTFPQAMMTPHWTIREIESNKSSCSINLNGKLDNIVEIPMKFEIINDHDTYIFHIIIKNAINFKYFDLNDFNQDYSGQTSINTSAITISTANEIYSFDANGTFVDDQNNVLTFDISFLNRKSQKSKMSKLILHSAKNGNAWQIEIRHGNQKIKANVPIVEIQKYLNDVILQQVIKRAKTKY